MKTFVVSLILLWSMGTNAQWLGVRAGRSLSPADYLSLRYEHWTNGAINLSLGGFFERSRERLLTYSCYGADLLAEYAANRNGDALPLFGLRFGLGSSWQVVDEPWLYKGLSFSERMNYGLLGEATIDCHLSDAFRLSVFGQHKYLFRSLAGRSRTCFGLGLAYHLSSY